MHQSTHHRGCLFCRPALLLPLSLAHNFYTGIKGLLLGSWLAMKVPWRPIKKEGTRLILMMAPPTTALFCVKTSHHYNLLLACPVRAVDHGRNFPHGTYVKLPVRMNEEWQNCTLVKKFSATSPGTTHGGSSFATNVNIPDFISEASLEMNPVHRRRPKFLFTKGNGRPSTPPTAKAPGGGTGTLETGSSNRSLETGLCSTI